MPTFIETQFPIARLSAESYKERKANNGQTLTGLGKWWGRKPLDSGAGFHPRHADAGLERPEEGPRDLPQDPDHGR